MPINFSNSFILGAAFWLLGGGVATASVDAQQELSKPTHTVDRLVDLEHAPRIHSRALEGRSTYVRFPDAVKRHVDRLAERRASVKATDVSSRSGEAKVDEDAAVGAFLDTYSNTFGVDRAQLRKTKVLVDGAGESRFYHLEQYIDGYRVYGGSIVVTLDSLNHVLGAHGHPMLESAIEDHYVGAQSLGASGVVNPIKKHLQRQITVTEEYGTLADGGCDASKWIVETVWYREGIVLGEQGDISLVDRVEGSCVFTSGQTMRFEAFGKLTIGASVLHINIK
jgi:hypothetical protein